MATGVRMGYREWITDTRKASITPRLEEGREVRGQGERGEWRGIGKGGEQRGEKKGGGETKEIVRVNYVRTTH